LFQRPHQIFREMARRGITVFFCTPEPRKDNVKSFKQVLPNLYLCESMACLASLKQEPVWIWIGWTAARSVLPFFEKTQTVYELIDELKLFAFYCKQMEIDHRWLMETSDIVLASANRLRDEMVSVRKDVMLLTNGAAVEDFIPDKDGNVPGDMQGILDKGRPVVGYYGAISPWLDYILLDSIVRSLPDMEFVFIGPDYAGASVHLPGEKNFHWLGPKPYAELKYYLSCFNVGIIPFRVDQVTHSVSPLKLFEYMAGGKPVVASDLQELRKYAEVLRAKDHADWIERIREAIRLGQDPEIVSGLHQVADENSWSRKVDQVLSAMAKVRC
jgi:glycosyltransferase involved in cell wall biosynthesis